MGVIKTEWNSNAETVKMFAQYKILINNLSLEIMKKNTSLFPIFYNGLRMYYLNLIPIIKDKSKEAFKERFNNLGNAITQMQYSGNHPRLVAEVEKDLINLWSDLLQKFQHTGLGTTTWEKASDKQILDRAF